MMETELNKNWNFSSGALKNVHSYPHPKIHPHNSLNSPGSKNPGVTLDKYWQLYFRIDPKTFKEQITLIQLQEPGEEGTLPNCYMRAV